MAIKDETGKRYGRLLVETTQHLVVVFRLKRVVKALISGVRLLNPQKRWVKPTDVLL